MWDATLVLAKFVWKTSISQSPPWSTSGSQDQYPSNFRFDGIFLSGSGPMRGSMTKHKPSVCRSGLNHAQEGLENSILHFGLD